MAVEISSVSTYKLQRYGGVTVQNEPVWFDSVSCDNPGPVEAAYKRMSLANPEVKYRIIKCTISETQVEQSYL